MDKFVKASEGHNIISTSSRGIALKILVKALRFSNPTEVLSVYNAYV